ncbi:uncharacterized protein BDR25DRAFT_359783 [Lindgomyces ingoldianus]|uniref:Uncharacterized protein n=1 Tax=Lindgomyces ingoldianus TaxID=673940 RepID=A0ACB6QIW0_9PLEO|nr:uncharacterized protein BDR25DRAFT_359783 [Lindgomyces ingoldianus]KAF2466450.1 hypothetical protein BDR25DRAFT_359783 [Lindgomyces ingoldianus]
MLSLPSGNVLGIGAEILAIYHTKLGAIPLATTECRVIGSMAEEGPLERWGTRVNIGVLSSHIGCVVRIGRLCHFEMDKRDVQVLDKITEEKEDSVILIQDIIRRHQKPHYQQPRSPGIRAHTSETHLQATGVTSYPVGHSASKRSCRHKSLALCDHVQCKQNENLKYSTTYHPNSYLLKKTLDAVRCNENYENFKSSLRNKSHILEDTKKKSIQRFVPHETTKYLQCKQQVNQSK